MKVIQGALLGGVVLWIWSTIFWAFSGIPVLGMMSFEDEAAVEKVLRENASDPGFYVLPAAYVPDGPSQSAMIENRMQKIATGFFFAGAVRTGGLGAFGGQIGASILGNIGSAGLATWLLLQLAPMAFHRRVFFIQICAMFAWVVAFYPDTIWWGVPRQFALMQLFDVLVGWSFAGVALAWLVGDEARESTSG